jgi:hypothetical protein
MQPEELFERLRRDNFKPVRIHMRDGRAFEVRTPGLTLVSRTDLVIGFPRPHDPDPEPIADKVVHVDPSDVLRLEPLAQPTSVG